MNILNILLPFQGRARNFAALLLAGGDPQTRSRLLQLRWTRIQDIDTVNISAVRSGHDVGLGFLVLGELVTVGDLLVFVVLILEVVTSIKPQKRRILSLNLKLATATDTLPKSLLASLPIFFIE